MSREEDIAWITARPKKQTKGVDVSNFGLSFLRYMTDEQIAYARAELELMDAGVPLEPHPWDE